MGDYYPSRAGGASLGMTARASLRIETRIQCILDKMPMNLMRWIVTNLCKLGLRLAYRIDAVEMQKVRREGPLIAFTNHTGRIEAPIIYTFLKPRPKVTAFAKAEMWQNPFLAFVSNLWEIIPIHRGESDMEGMRRALDALSNGYILGIAPEGTRSRTGCLNRAQPGIAVLALHSGAPLQPIAHWGGEHRRKGLNRFVRPRFNMSVGPAFRVDSKGGRVTREGRQEIADELMYQLARLLPEKLRGHYADLSKATEKWLAFEGS
jgi:1-acyl-sn-glycerol-3-phosphate acyltransferase